jgi:hypothetical protein
MEVPMVYSQSPPLVEKEWLTAAEELSPGGRARDLDARSDERIGIPNKRSIHSPHSSSFRDGQVASGRRSIGMRIFRTVTRFFIAVLIGVGATLAWQSHGDAAREMLLTRAPTLAWLLPVSTTKSPVVVATTPDLAQQLGPLASNLDVVRRSVEQLAYKQEQIAQNIAALQAVEEDIRLKMSFTPPSPVPVQQAASIPQPKPPQPRAQSSAAQPSSVPRPSPPAGTLSR